MLLPMYFVLALKKPLISAPKSEAHQPVVNLPTEQAHGPNQAPGKVSLAVDRSALHRKTPWGLSCESKVVAKRKTTISAGYRLRWILSLALRVLVVGSLPISEPFDQIWVRSFNNKFLLWTEEGNWSQDSSLGLLTRQGCSTCQKVVVLLVASCTQTLMSRAITAQCLPVSVSTSLEGGVEKIEDLWELHWK